MAFFFMKLVPPRPTFPGDATDEEMRAMQRHADYIRALIADDKIVCAGPVMDPDGSWGAAIMEAENDTEVSEIGKNDPVVLAGLGFRWDHRPMGSLLQKES